METLTEKEFIERKLYLEKCEDCGKEVDMRDDKFITLASSSLFGKYYEGKGVCDKCLENRYEEAHIKYNDVSDESV